MTEDEIDALAREIYHARSQSARPMTDERWARIKQKFPASVRACREEALRMEEQGDLDD